MKSSSRYLLLAFINVFCMGEFVSILELCEKKVMFMYISTVISKFTTQKKIDKLRNEEDNRTVFVEIIFQTHTGFS